MELYDNGILRFLEQKRMLDLKVILCDGESCGPEPLKLAIEDVPPLCQDLLPVKVIQRRFFPHTLLVVSARLES